MYTLLDPAPAKEEHYTSLFFPRHDPTSPPSKHHALLRTLLPYLPEPVPFAPLLDRLRADVRASIERGSLTMVGEIGLDGGARMRWPIAARQLYEERVPQPTEGDGEGGGGDGGAWKRLTPFKTSMAHQRAIVEKQLDVAVELGVNVSFHSVAAAGEAPFPPRPGRSAPRSSDQNRLTRHQTGPTYDVLVAMRKKRGARFTQRVNVDVHSGGGWSAEFWTQAEVRDE